MHSYNPRSRRPLQGRVLRDERTEKRLRRTRWRRIGIALGVLALLISALALYRSPLLRVQEVQVVGAIHIDPQQVADLASVQGASMLNPPLGRIESRIAALPLVKSVQAQRRWPNTVRIEVTERTPWGYWTIGDTPYVIDAEATVLPDVLPPEGAPVIRDLGGPAKLIPGDRVDVDAVALAQALLQQVPPALALGIAAFDYTPQAGLALTTDISYRVVLGDSQNFEYKLAVWRAVEQEIGREAMTGHVLDLRFEDRPSLQ